MKWKEKKNQKSKAKKNKFISMPIFRLKLRNNKNPFYLKFDPSKIGSVGHGVWVPSGHE